MDVAEILETITIPSEDRCTSVRPAEAEFIHRWIKDHRLSKTLEVGLAYGASAASIMAAHESEHTCMDPFQDWFDNLGLENLRLLGFGDRLDFHPGYSHDVLPRLHAEQKIYDFAFIDGGHLFDQVFVDFYHVDLLLELGGYVVLHDTWMRSTQMVASFIRKNRPDYQRLRTPVRNLILLQKREGSKDERPWYHFREFYTRRSWLSQRFVTMLIRRGLSRTKNP